ncbi:undecaprenyl-phosphate glucose phosphotransferase [Rheinheimera sp. 1928-s]|uniref:undecaprenyl-phosphate glucose phosphotransferase n=1 Tax=Rheinheimera sp. 1928-s TaxID=3033803 RepID=UPI00262E1031|nr:undecaprenyl-phosphate glucose phosphotransferase [Rheinheimera sp. 1928-s]MDF3125670.1 undecaprenyl-phosphate glucose phosphotransferase [Rheinheimera sp. 1928-s]
MNTPTSFKKEDSGFGFLNRFLDIIAIGAALYLSLKLYGEVVTTSYIMLYFSVMAVYLYTAESVQLYRSWRIGSVTSNIAVVMLCLFVAFSLMQLVTFGLKSTADYSRVVIVGWFALSFCYTSVWRIAARFLKNTLHKNGYNLRRVAVIGCTFNAKRLIDEMTNKPQLGLQFCNVYDDREVDRLPECGKTITGKIDECVESARDGAFDKLYITLPLSADKRIADIIQRLGDTTVDVHIVPDFLLYNLMHARLGTIGDVETLSVFESPYYGAHDWLKRSFDVTVSFIALLVLAIPMLVIAAAIKITSRGPVLFKQDRYGLDGKAIRVFKFRSMTVQDNGANVVQAKKGDARITPLGAMLRRTSLDELPQFINVLRGEMSVVGPRPHAVAHNEQYRKLVAFYMLRHKVKPGITGWAQINGWRGETDSLEKMEKRVEFDLTYIKNWSLWWDTKIVFLTFFRGFTGKNVY